MTRIDRDLSGLTAQTRGIRMRRPIGDRRGRLSPDAAFAGLMHINATTRAERRRARAQGPSALDSRTMRTTLEQVRPACANAVSCIRFATADVRNAR
ncbi:MULTISPECIES: hypothetical protein [unclassified Burkholderia]|uniref:hypothetical protein n=1 Tax=unclassified Burkholderia TaxID=2613784 RepID=UPI002AB02B9F|nr:MULTISPECIES: hypothetical protein [unclassified Burkholderia]